MSTLSLPASFSTVGQEPCWRCGTPTPSDHVADPLYCTACARMAVDSALAELAGHVRALRSGAAPFDVLTPDEREEQIDALIGDDSPDPITRAQIEQPADFAGIDLAEFVGYRAVG